jgi:ankyrin repeat protein
MPTDIEKWCAYLVHQAMNLAIDKIIHDNSKELSDLITAGLDVSMSFGRSKRQLVHVAASFGACNCLTVLLKHGAIVDVQDSTGVTSVHLAARNGHKRCLRLLVEQFKADMRIVDSDGYTVTHNLACNGRTELLAYLLTLSSNTSDLDRIGLVGMTSFFFVPILS